MNDVIQHGFVTVAFVLFGGFAAAYEAAIQSFRVSRLEDLLEANGRTRDRFLNDILEETNAFRLAAAFSSALCNGGFILYAGWAWVAPYMQGGDLSATGWAHVGYLLVAMMLLRGGSALAGDILAERLVLSMARPAWFLTFPLRPVTRLLLGAHRVVARGVGRDVGKSREDLEDEVIAAVSDGELKGVVEEEQREMIERVFELRDSDVADIFTPRTEMVTVEVGDGLEEAIRVSVESGHSRLPVHEGTRDNIIGIFYVRDALLHWDAGREKAPPLREMLRKPLFVPETKNVSELLQEMQRGKLHIAIVLDEYGGTAGLVTIEDVLEELVGEIHDEFDKEEIESSIRRISPHTIVAHGHEHVHSVNEALDKELLPEDDDYETLAGFVLDNLGHIPEPGETFLHAGWQFRILTADERRVGDVEIRPATADDSASAR